MIAAAIAGFILGLAAWGHAGARWSRLSYACSSP